jgi:hypothetical protein
MNEIDEVQSLIRAAGTSRQGLETVLATARELRRARDRTLIVKFVGGLYVCTVGLAVGYLIIRGIGFGDKEAFANIFELIKVSVIPVVTLVIGYYFGSEKM